MSNEEEYQQRLRNLVDELRVWKDKVRKLQEQQEKEEKSKATQSDVLNKMLEDNEKYKTMIANLRQEKGFAESPMGKDAAKVD